MRSFEDGVLLASKGCPPRLRDSGGMTSTESPDAIIEEFLLRVERAGLAGIVVVDVNSAEGVGLSLDRIVVYEQQRGRGVADRFVSLFVQLCDDYGRDSEVSQGCLTPARHRRGLERLYARHGFSHSSSGVDSEMRRRARFDNL